MTVIARPCEWDDYGQAVLSGEIAACKWTRLGVERHYRDLAGSPDNGLVFSAAHAEYAIGFFAKFLRHSIGEFAGKPFVLSPWQKFHIALAFGWYRVDGVRRFRDVYVFVPRKNGKTTEMAGVSLFMLEMDGEPGAQVYMAATKMDQAKLMYNDSVNMVKSSGVLSRHIKLLKDGAYSQAGRNILKPLGRDSKSMDGFNPHAVMLDELHAQKTSEVYDVMKSAIGARRNPMIWMITTAGFDLSSFGYEMHRYAESVLQGTIQDDDFLAIVYTVDDQEAWDDPLEWRKANPNYGVSIYQDGMERDCERARKQPSQQVNFKTKRLNIWCSSGSTWIPLERWRDCADGKMKLEDFHGQPCWIGIDLAEKNDVVALCLVFRQGKRFFVFPRLYQNAYQIAQPENQHYRTFVAMGDLIETEGNTIDLEIIRQDLLELKARFKVQEVAYDPRFSSYLATTLIKDGLPMVEITQRSTFFTQPINEIESLVMSGNLHHDGNRMMEWMMTNVVMAISKFSGLKTPIKENPREKIDGVLALLMAMGRALADAGGIVDIDDEISRQVII